MAKKSTYSPSAEIDRLFELVNDMVKPSGRRFQRWGAYGKVGISESVGEHGGIRDVSHFLTKNELIAFLHAMILGIQLGKASAQPVPDHVTAD